MSARNPDGAAANLGAKQRRNWWKIGFFIALLAFEIAREAAVLAADQKATPNSRAHVFSIDGYTTAEGRWKRIDGGGPLIPAAVTIECRQELKQCIEASVMMNDNYVYAPDLNWFPATFTPNAVTYENDIPECARYSVRIDLKLQKAFAVRERKDKIVKPICAKLDQRVEMQLADGYDPQPDPLEGHFVPVIQIIAVIAQAL